MPTPEKANSTMLVRPKNAPPGLLEVGQRLCNQMWQHFDRPGLWSPPKWVGRQHQTGPLLKKPALQGGVFASLGVLKKAGVSASASFKNTSLQAKLRAISWLFAHSACCVVCPLEEGLQCGDQVLAHGVALEKEVE
jgi:hypothetical protein